MSHLNVLTSATAPLGCGAARGVTGTALSLHWRLHRSSYEAPALSRSAPRASASLVLPPDSAAYGINPGPQQTQTMGELCSHWQQSVGHIGPQYILT